MKQSIKVIIFIIILVLLIILPPFFRVIFPRYKDNLTINSNKKLFCQTKTADNYTIIYETNYKNDKVDKIKIKFMNNEKNNSSITSSLFYHQVDYFCGLPNSTYQYINTDIIINLNQKVYQANKHDKTIQSMYQSYSKVKKYYEKLGYTCK